ncbi:MAG: threonine--tRNA ligase [Methanomassiliicoccales archaeon]
MRILFIHADSMSYEVKSKTRWAEEIDEKGTKGEMKDVLVCFITVEKEDEDKKAETAIAACENISEIAEKVGTRRVLLYPYAHLSSDLSSPEGAVAILKEMEKLCSGKFETVRAPFGWYKSFTIACKGHPLSELSRQITATAPEKKRGEGTYLILTRDGKIVEPADFVGGSACFTSMVKKEALKEQVGSSASPEYLKLCKKFGIEWERMSDIGHEVYHPEAAVMFDLAADYASQVVRNIGLSVFTVKGTNMFNLNEPAVREHAELFGDRLYKLQSDEKEYVLRYAACHQQFSMMSRWNISYRQMPVAAFEIADAYRYEQSGETMLLFRLRRLNMPDLHVLCTNMGEAYSWFERIHERIYREANVIGFDYEMLVNVSSRKAFEDNKEFILSLLRKKNKDCLVHIYPEGVNFYWTVNIEYHMLDEMGRAREIGTVQIDTGNAKRFDITYTDAEGKKQYPIILHTAVVGTIERFLYALFDRAIQRSKENGKPGYLPLWITPEQVRLIPMGEKHRDRAKALMAELKKAGFRVGMDDRELTLAKRVREAKQDWVSFAIVIGDKELEHEILPVYDREEDRQVEMQLDGLIKLMRRRVEGYPSRPLYMPEELTKRVDFSL